MDGNKDLLAKAQEYSSNNVDLYQLLKIDSTVTEENAIQRAWKKESLKYHPDKTKDAYDPEKWDFLQTARNILVDTAARAAYDNARKAALMRKAERDRVEGHRRRFIDQLEADEEAAKKLRLAEEERKREVERERERLREEGRRRMAEEEEQRLRDNERLARLKREREEPEEDIEALARRRLKERKDKKKKQNNKGEAVSDGDAAANPDTPPEPEAPRKPPVWEDLKARMLEAQRKKEAMNAAKAANAS